MSQATAWFLGKLGRSMLRHYKLQVQMKFPNFLYRGVK
jgi:hypothetical protein